MNTIFLVREILSQLEADGICYAVTKGEYGPEDCPVEKLVNAARRLDAMMEAERRRMARLHGAARPAVGPRGPRPGAAREGGGR